MCAIEGYSLSYSLLAAARKIVRGHEDERMGTSRTSACRGSLAQLAPLEGSHLTRTEADGDRGFRPAGLARRPWAGDAKRVTLDESGQNLLVEVEHAFVVELQHHRAVD
jgi:hypothetical protein